MGDDALDADILHLNESAANDGGDKEDMVTPYSRRVSAKNRAPVILGMGCLLFKLVCDPLDSQPAVVWVRIPSDEGSVH